MKINIFLDAPNVGTLEKKYLCEAVDSGFVSTIGPFVREFEDSFSNYVGRDKAVAVQSGTAALQIALHELGIGPGDEVIVPVVTFIATVNPVLLAGAKPVFVDIDRKTWNIDVSQIEKHLTKRTKAILPVHLYGNPCDMTAINRIAKKHALFVIEDATESLGALFNGKHTGTFGDLGCFSFNGNKVITTGGGGMIIGKGLKKLEHIRFLVNQARDESRGYYHPEIGFNYRMTNIEASLGIAQMRRLPGFLKQKKVFADIYRQELNDLNGIAFQEPLAGASSSNWLNCITLNDGRDIAFLQEKLREKGVPSRRIFMPLTEFPPYLKYKKGEYPNARHVYDKGLCLPSSTLNSPASISYICRSIKQILKGKHGKN
jgi:perosamine synthetase